MTKIINQNFLLPIANVAPATVSSILNFSQCQFVNIFPQQNFGSFQA